MENTTLKRAEEAFDKLPFGITTPMNIEILGEMKGIEIPARNEFKAFFLSQLSLSIKEARQERDEEIVELLQNTVMQHVPDDSKLISHRVLKDFISALANKQAEYIKTL